MTMIYNDGSDDGFSSPGPTRGVPALWDDQKGWHDRDGLPLPALLLAISIDTFLRRWHPKYEEIRTKPLPDAALLNSAIPAAEWRTGLDGQPERPWKLNYEICMVDPATGKLYKYANSTWGAQRCYDELKEAVATMRMLRGARVFPLVEPGKRPMPTNYGLKSRPHLRITGDWREPPQHDGGQLPPPSTPSLPPPVQAAPTSAVPASAPAAAPTATASAAAPVVSPATAPAVVALKAAQATLDAMQPVKPVPIEEFINDSLPPWA
jgi:hypothetical protein